MNWKKFCDINMVPSSYLECSIENLKQFHETAHIFLMRPFSLLLTGDCGRGKTYFLFTLLKELLETKGLHVAHIRYLNAYELEERVDEEIANCRSAKYFIESLCDVYCLFIDDFGVEKTRERAERNYYKLLDKRLANSMPTVLSTNLTNQEILETYGARIASRLKLCKHLHFKGADLRVYSPQGKPNE